MRAALGKHKRHAERLHGSQQNCQVARDFGDAFAARFAFLLHRVELRQGNRHHLHDDRGVDIRPDSHRKDRHTPQRAAGEHVHQAQDTATARALDIAINYGVIYAGNRNMRAHSENRKHRQNKNDAFPDFGDAPGPLECFNHLDSLLSVGRSLQCRSALLAVLRSLASAFQHFGGSARSREFFLGAGAELVRVNRQSL